MGGVVLFLALRAKPVPRKKESKLEAGLQEAVEQEARANIQWAGQGRVSECLG